MRCLMMFVVMVLVVSVISCSAKAQPNIGEEDAIAASNAWLELVDSGDYEKSWEESAAYFRNAVNKNLWEQQLMAGRKPLGKVVSRDIRSTQYATSLPGAPDGEYVVIQYETSFENKKSAVETVTPMKEESGLWRVSGYYIR